MDNKTLVRNMIENVFNKGDIAHLSTYYADKCMYHDALNNVVGLNDLKKSMEGYTTAFSNRKVVIEEQIAEGDLVTTRMTCSAKDTGGLMGRPATGKSFQMTAIQLDRIRDGKIAETWFQGDFIAMLQQLGTIPRFDATTQPNQQYQPNAK